METTLNNGTQYRFEEIFKNYISTYCFYDGKWNPICKDFHSWNEVYAWIEEMNKPVKFSFLSDCGTPDYYGTGCYCGD